MNRTTTVEGLVADQLKSDEEVNEVAVGDTIDVHYRIVEGDKERIQVFQGVLIGMKGRGVNRTITVRRIVANEGVERIFPLHSPRIAKLEVVRRGEEGVYEWRLKRRSYGVEINFNHDAQVPPIGHLSDTYLTPI